jgi:hypothetical protein
MRVSIVKASKLTLARPDFSFRLFHEATLRLLRELSLLPTYSCSCFRLQSTRIWAGVIRRGFIPLLGCITVINLSDYANQEISSVITCCGLRFPIHQECRRHRHPNQCGYPHRRYRSQIDQ